MQSGQQPDETAVPLLESTEQDQLQSAPSDSNSFPLQSDPLADRSVSEQLPQAAEQSPAFEQPERLATGRSRPHHEEDHQHDQEHHGHEDESNPPAGEYDVMPPSFDNVNDFETANPATGFLKIFVTTAQKALPVQGARCIVSRTFGSEPYIFYTVSTNQDGATQPMPLPAPVRRLSEDPNENVLPFASYDITVTKNGFLDVRLQDVAIFDGIISIQSIDLIPTGGFSFDSIRSLAEK